MTRYFILTASFFLLFSLGYAGAKSNDQAAATISSNDYNETGNTARNIADNPGKALPVSQDPKSHLPAGKAHSQAPAMDETPHIHHFHKERIKKIKKHHLKFWAISKLILILCHISLLIIAYLHILH